MTHARHVIEPTGDSVRAVTLKTDSYQEFLAVADVDYRVHFKAIPVNSEEEEIHDG